MRRARAGVRHFQYVPRLDASFSDLKNVTTNGVFRVGSRQSAVASAVGSRSQSAVGRLSGCMREK